MLSSLIFGVLLLAAATMADESETTTTTTTTVAPSADSDADVVVWRYGEQRPPQWPFPIFRQPNPTDIIDPGFSPDFYKRLRVPQVPTSESASPFAGSKVHRVELAKVRPEEEPAENDTSKTSEADSGKEGPLEAQNDPGVTVEPIVRPPPVRIPVDPGFAPDFYQRLRAAMTPDTEPVGEANEYDTKAETTSSQPIPVQNETRRRRRQAPSSAAEGASRTNGSSVFNELFGDSSLPSRILERLPSGIVDAGFAPNALNTYLRGLLNNQHQQQRQHTSSTQVPQLYPDLEGEKIDPRAAATGGQDRRDTPFRRTTDLQNGFSRFLEGLLSGQPQQQPHQATRQRPEVQGTNLDARSLATAGQNRQDGVQRLPEAAKELFQGFGQLGNDVLNRLNVYRNENAFAEFLQNMHQPSSSRDFFANLFGKEPTS